MTSNSTPLAALMKERGITQKTISEFLGVTRQAVQRWQSGAPMRMETLKKLSEYFGVSVAYLTGEISDPLPQGAIISVDERETIDGFTKVPIYNADVGCNPNAGSQLCEFISGFIALADWFLRSLPGVTSIGHLAFVPSSGDSMEPTISNRALLLVDRNQCRITGAGIYCIRVIDQVMAKRVELNLDGTYTLLSDNPLYPPKTIPREDMDRAEIIGRVIYALNGRTFH